VAEAEAVAVTVTVTEGVAVAVSVAVTEAVGVAESVAETEAVTVAEPNILSGVDGVRASKCSEVKLTVDVAFTFNQKTEPPTLIVSRFLSSCTEW
jgi:hypothetical protein